MRKIKRRKKKEKTIPTRKRALIKRKTLPDSEDEKYILAFMIMHHNVCDSVYRYFKDKQLRLGHLAGPYRKQYKSVLAFYEKYKMAPRRTIKFIHEGQKAKLRTDEIEITEKLLEVIAKEYRAARESYNISPLFVIEEMIPRFIRSRKINSLNQRIQQAIDTGDIVKAEKFIVKYDEVTQETPDSTYGFTEPLTLNYHEDRIKRLENEGSKVIFYFDKRLGAIGSLIGPLKKQWLVSISGSTKSGKSYFMLDMAMEAALIHKRKVMFLCPEMSEDDMVEERINAWLTERAIDKDHVGVNYIPEIDCINNQTGKCQALKKLPNTYTIVDKIGSAYTTIQADDKKCKNWKICTKCRHKPTGSVVLTKRFLPAVFFRRKYIKKFRPKHIIESLKELENRPIHNLKIKYFPKYSATIEDAFADIKRYSEKHNWKPEIVFVDYIDILKQSSDNKEISWQDIDHMWKRASGFAQEMDALIITADQTTKEGRKSRLLDEMSTPQASTKDHHINLKIGLVKHNEETKNNICRANVIYHRHRAFDRKHEVLITQNLTMGYAITDSVFWYDKNMPPYPIQIPDKI